MRYKVQEKPFTPNQKILSPDTEKILNTMQNNFNACFVSTQNTNYQNAQNNLNDNAQTNFQNNQQSNNYAGSQNGVYNSNSNEQNGVNNNQNNYETSPNNLGGLFGGLNGGGIEKLLPLLMLMNRQNVNTLSTQTQSTSADSNPNINMFKLLSESGLLGKNLSPDKLKLFEMLMNMNSLKKQSTPQTKTNNEQPNNTNNENKQADNNNENKQADNNNENNNIKKQNCETENFTEPQEENEINNFETNKSVRE